MEEKKTSKISLSTVFLILAVIVIAVMGVFIFKLNSDKNAESQKAAALQSQLDGLNGTVSSLQEQIDKVTETTATTTSSTTTQDQTKATSEATSETSADQITYNHSDLKEFWTNFRAAVLSGDYNEIKKFVKFPLQAPGPYDSDPVKKIKEEDFEEVFIKLLQQDQGDLEATIFDWIKNHEMPEMLGGDDYDNNGSGRYIDIVRVEGDWAMFSDMVMEKDESGYWKLTTIYVSED